MVKEATFYRNLGCTLTLLAASSYHRSFALGTYINQEILPPLLRKQFKLYLDNMGQPRALVTWAWITEKTEHEIHTKGRVLEFEEWKEGPRLFINDWITPYGNIREVVHDMAHVVFPDHLATSVRRTPDGKSVRRIKRWTGHNLRLAARKA